VVPSWTWWSVLAGAVYLVVQVRAVGHAGGADFFAYRISLEPLVLAAPLLMAATARIVELSVGSADRPPGGSATRRTASGPVGPSRAGRGRARGNRSRLAERSLVVTSSLLAVVSVGVHAFGATARSVSPELQDEWIQIDEQVRSEFGDDGVRIEDL
jgi:hypothetical protein